jgi:hypothetical protein
MPESFLIRVTAELGIDLPPRNYYGVGMCFLPTDESLRSQVKALMVEVSTKYCSPFSQSAYDALSLHRHSSSRGGSSRTPLLRTTFGNRHGEAGCKRTSQISESDPCEAQSLNSVAAASSSHPATELPTTRNGWMHAG